MAIQSQDLHDASVQEIWLELIRRYRYNEFDGSKVVADLEDHRDLWVSVVMLRAEQELAITLRDMPKNFWNVDSLFILATGNASAKALIGLAREHWGADRALIGKYPMHDNLDKPVVMVWWD